MRISTLTLVLALFTGGSQAQFIAEKAFKLSTGQTLGDLLAKGDFNHDNKLDVLVSSLNSSRQPALVVFPGTGGGGFGTPIVTEISGANNPAIAAVGDLNGDEIVDAVITGTNSITGVTEIGVMLADGTGKFNAPVFFRSTITGAIVVGDFTNDKKADLAVFGTLVTVFPGNGDGTFGSPVSSAFGGGAGCSAVADFNKDGKLDITTGGSVLLGNGDGTFQSPLAVVGGFCDVAVGDFNKDGIPDIVTGDSRTTGSGVLVFLGDGTGKFKKSTSYFTGDGAAQALGLGIAIDNFTADGNLDIAVLNARDADITMLLGNGDGTFALGSTFAVSSYYGILSGDFNGDHKTDVAVPTALGLSVLLGKGNGTLTAQVAQNFFFPTGDIRLADFNGDHKVDLIEFGDVYDPYISVRFGNGDGTFGNPNGLPTSCTTKVVGAVADFNRDKTPDVAFVPPNGSTGIGVCLGNGNGTFKNAVIYDAGVQHGMVLAGDFTHDGKLDLLASDIGGFSILPGNGDGTFGSALTTALTNFSTFTTGDFNHDGKLDVAALLNTGEIAVLLGKGDGTFEAPVTSSNPNGSVMILAGDLNKDGNLDVVTANSGTPRGVNILLGNGDGTFKTPSFRALATPNSAQLRDVNGDANLDLIAIAAGFLDVLLGNGNGTFQPTKSFVAAGHGFMAVADLNGDGLLDVVDLHSQFGKGGIIIYLNQGH